jgi:hypothetical protein
MVYGDEQVLADVNALVAVRDVLAHRYLRVRYTDDAGFEPQVVPELLGYGVRFMRSERRLRGAYMAMAGGSDDREQLSDEMQAHVAAIARAVRDGKPIELD